MSTLVKGTVLVLLIPSIVLQGLLRTVINLSSLGIVQSYNEPLFYVHTLSPPNIIATPTKDGLV